MSHDDTPPSVEYSLMRIADALERLVALAEHIAAAGEPRVCAIDRPYEGPRADGPACEEFKSKPY
jgi:hypothetical protein